MSALSDCGACMIGDHAHHDGKHRGLPNVLGGSICVCSGDCAERHAEAMERIFGPLMKMLNGHSDQKTTESDQNP